MLRQIARNVFNIVRSSLRSGCTVEPTLLQVVMLDPLSPPGMEMVEYVKLFLDHFVPARFGLVLLPDPQNQAAVAVSQGFAFLSAKFSPREGLRWLMKVRQAAGLSCQGDGQ